MNRRDVVKMALSGAEEMTIENLKKYYTDDFIVTNLNNNEVLTKGLTDFKNMTDSNRDNGISFSVLDSKSEGDFEVFTYRWSNGSVEGDYTALLRFRGDKISELIILNND